MKRMRVLVGAVLAALLIFAGTTPALAISDGSDATESYPFMGAYKPGFPTPPGAGGNGCGVTLIDPQWGLTAAHCRKNNFAQVGSPVDWTVQFGSADVTKGGEVATVSRFFQLPESRRPWWGKDLMLLRFEEPVSQAPIPIATESPETGTAGRILGWGNTAPAPEAVYPKLLQEADVAVLDPSTCPNASDGDLCLGGGAAKAGNADSGGPFLVRQGEGWALAGVLSGPEEDNEVATGLFTDVTRHADWIRTIMETHATIPDDVVDTGLGGYPAIGECGASIVRTTASRDSDPALLLTNGHCLPVVDEKGVLPDPGELVTDEPVDVVVPFTDAQGYELTTARIERLLFATMTGTDVALYRLDTTFADLAARGATILEVTSVPPRAGDTVALKSEDPLTCTVEAVVPTLREGGYELHDSLRMVKDSACETYPGASGSALVAADGKTIVGVHNTHNEDGKKCTDNNPCEVDANGKTTVRKGYSYGQQIVELNDCVIAGSEFDANAAGCDLATAPTTGATLNVPLVLGATVLGLGVVALLLALVSRSRQRRIAPATEDDRS